MKVVLKLLLVIAIGAMGYVCVSSIMVPTEFNSTRESREKEIIARLVDIRKAQVEYKNVHKAHAGSFEDLIKFLKEEKLPFLIKEGVLTDEQLEDGMTEQQAVKEGLIKRDTVWVVAKDTLFGPSSNVDNFAQIPGLNTKFKMDTTTLTSGSGYTVKVFECSVEFDEYLGDLNKQLLYNIKDIAEKQSKFAGLKVGSLTEINNNAGNWE